MPPNSSSDVLRQILARGQKFQKYFSTLKKPTPPTEIIPIPELQLSYPQEILDSLAALGLPKPTHELIDSKLREQITSLETLVRQAYKHTCEDSRHLSMDFKRLQLFYESVHRDRYLPALQEKVSKIGTLLEKKNHRVVNKPAFNPEFIPILEKYFDLNAFPSASDRHSLAQFTKMTSQQIQVWFQNRRSRTKRSGIGLRKATTPHVIDLVIPLPDSPSPSTRQSSLQPVDDSMRQTILPSLSPDLLSLTERPPYAFPTVYSASSTLGAFEQDSPYFKCQPIVWPRMPTRPPSACSPPLSSVDELCSLFSSKLNLAERHSKRRTSTTPPASIWYLSSTTVIPPPAPLLSLVPCRNVCADSISSTSLTTNTGIRSQHNALSVRTSSPFPSHSKYSPSSPPTVFSHGPVRSRVSSNASTMSFESSGPLTPPQSSPHTTPARGILTQSDLDLLGELFSNSNQPLSSPISAYCVPEPLRYNSTIHPPPSHPFFMPTLLGLS